MAQRGIERGIQARRFGNARIVRGRDNRVEVALEDARADDEIGDLALFANLPVDELFDVGVVRIEHDHLGRAPRRAARFNRPGCAIENLEKRHQAARSAAAGELLARRAQLREVCAAAAAALKDARLAQYAVEDAAVVDEIVFNAEDEARADLRVREGIRRRLRHVIARVDVPVALRRPGNAVRPVQSRVEPLWRVRRADLAREHRAHLVVVDLRVVFRVEVAVFPAPVGPAAGHPVEDLAGVSLRAELVVAGEGIEGRAIGDRTRKPLRHALFPDAHRTRGNPRLAAVFLGKDVHRDLAPDGRNHDVLCLKDHGSVGIDDLGGARLKSHARIWVAGGGVGARKLHTWLLDSSRYIEHAFEQNSFGSRGLVTYCGISRLETTRYGGRR